MKIFIKRRCMFGLKLIVVFDLSPGRYDRTVDDVISEVQQAKRLPELGQVSDMATIAMTTNSVLGKIEEENGGR